MTRVAGASLCSRLAAARQLVAWPPVRRLASGRPWPSLKAWILVVRPPRLTPIAWAFDALFLKRRSCAPRCGCCRATRRKVDRRPRPTSLDTCCQTPSADQRTKRLCSVLRGHTRLEHRPSARHCNATTMPLITRRSSPPAIPSGLAGNNGAGPLPLRVAQPKAS